MLSNILMSQCLDILKSLTYKVSNKMMLKKKSVGHVGRSIGFVFPSGNTSTS